MHEELKISVCIITFNEERNIERCLKSILSIADEIIVVDSFSTDKTEEICKKYEVKFIKNAFLGHIQQKNFAMQCATNDFVLSLDADECLSDELKKSIEFIKEKGAKYDAYSMNRLNNYCGKWIHFSGWYPDRKTRLWNKNLGEWGGLNPHDKVIMNANAKTFQLTGDLLHYTYYSIAEHDKQNEKFARIGAQAMINAGKNATFINLFLNPIIRFTKDYVVKMGFRDGKAGWQICTRNAEYTFKKYKYYLELKRKN